MHSCFVELGAAGYIPVFETYQLLFIHPFVSVCNSARLGFFVSLSPQTVPRIGKTEASDLLQSYLFNEMHALLPYVPKRLLSVRKGLSMPLQALFFCQDCTLSLSFVSNAGRKRVPIPSIPSHAPAAVILSQYLQQNNYFPLRSLLAPFPLPGIGNGQLRPPPAREIGTGRPSSPGRLSIPAGIQRCSPGSMSRAAPAPLPARRSPASEHSRARPALPLAGRRLWQPARGRDLAAAAGRSRAATGRAGLLGTAATAARGAPPAHGQEDADARPGAGGQRGRAWGWTLPGGTRSLPAPSPLLPLGVSAPAAAEGGPHRASAGHGAVRGEQESFPWHGKPVCVGQGTVFIQRHG